MTIPKCTLYMFGQLVMAVILHVVGDQEGLLAHSNLSWLVALSRASRTLFLCLCCSCVTLVVCGAVTGCVLWHWQAFE